MRKATMANSAKKVLARVTALALAVATMFSAVPSNVEASAKSVSNYYITENNFTDTMETVVKPYIEQYKKTGYVAGQKDEKLYYEEYFLENAKGTIVISHGLTETLEKYDEMIYYFLSMGYSVYGMEHRGHGRSGRLGVDDTQINVEKFSYYYKDLKNFLDLVVIPQAGKSNLYLFAHSMGGGIGARFLEEYPGYFKAAILSAPMMEIVTGDIPTLLAKIIAHTANGLFWGDDYVLGQGPFSATYDFENANSHSEVRYALNWKLRNENSELCMGGSSYKWLSESFHATKDLTAKKNASKVSIPILLFQAGQDTLVAPKGHETFAKYAKNCTIVRYENAKHEIYAETDEILPDYLDRVFNFLGEN